MHQKTEPTDLAFPFDVTWNDQTRETHRGLTKRECFAGQIFAALLSKPASEGWNNADYARSAVSSADNLIAALNGDLKR